MKIKRIFLTFKKSASSGFEDSIWENIFLHTLTAMGYDVVYFPYHLAVEAASKNGRNDLNAISEAIYDSFEKEHKKQSFDLFLAYYHSGNVTPELFRKVREKTFTVNYTTNFHQIGDYLSILKEVDLATYASKPAEAYFKSHDIRGYWMPFAGLQKNARFAENKIEQISFVGTSYGNRPYYLWRLLQHQINIVIYGANWIRNHKKRAILRSLLLDTKLFSNKPEMVNTAYQVLSDTILYQINKDYKERIFPPLSDKAYFELLENSLIILNFPESRYSHDYANPNVLMGANLRDFEVPMSGSMLLTQYNTEIEAFFDLSKEVVTFNNEFEMVDKAKYYLNHYAEANKIALAGHQRALKDHTWENRFADFFNFLEKEHI